MVLAGGWYGVKGHLRFSFGLVLFYSFPEHMCVLMEMK